MDHFTLGCAALYQCLNITNHVTVDAILLFEPYSVVTLADCPQQSPLININSIATFSDQMVMLDGHLLV